MTPDTHEQMGSSLPMIKMVKTKCRGICPEYTLEISEGNIMKLNGRKNISYIGDFHATLFQNSATELENLFALSDFSNLNDKYYSGVMDLPATYITYGEKTVVVVDQSPESLNEVISYLHELVVSTDWKAEEN